MNHQTQKSQEKVQKLRQRNKELDRQNKTPPNQFRGQPRKPLPPTSSRGATQPPPARTGGTPPSFLLPPLPMDRLHPPGTPSSALPDKFRGKSRRHPPPTSSRGATPPPSARAEGTPLSPAQPQPFMGRPLCPVNLSLALPDKFRDKTRRHPLSTSSRGATPPLSARAEGAPSSPAQPKPFMGRPLCPVKLSLDLPVKFRGKSKEHPPPTSSPNATPPPPARAEGAPLSSAQPQPAMGRPLRPVNLSLELPDEFRGQSRRPLPPTSSRGTTPPPPARAEGASLSSAQPQPVMGRPLRPVNLSLELPDEFRGQSRRPLQPTSPRGTTPPPPARAEGAPLSSAQPQPVMGRPLRPVNLSLAPPDKFKGQSTRPTPPTSSRGATPPPSARDEGTSLSPAQPQPSMGRQLRPVIPSSAPTDKFRRQSRRHPPPISSRGATPSSSAGASPKKVQKFGQRKRELKGTVNQQTQKSPKKVRRPGHRKNVLNRQNKRSQEKVQEREQRNKELNRQNEKITQLDHYWINTSHQLRGICLLINNVPSMAVKVERQYKDLFERLFFDVQVRRRLQMLQIYNVAKEFANKDHSQFDSFVFIIMSRCQDNDISGVDRRKASLEHVMTEYTSTNCPTLSEKPKLFFVHRFTILKRHKVSEDSIQAQCSTDVGVEMQPVSPSANIGGRNCPEEADFLLACVTSAVDEGKPIQEAAALLFIQVIQRCYHRHHLLEMLIKVNKRIADEQRGNPNGGITVQVPYLTHTLRAKVHLGSTPVPLQVTGFSIPDEAQRNCYKHDRRPRGFCVIINNVKFSDKEMNRTGAVKDEIKLKKLFKELFFTVIVKKNLTKHQMENVAADYGAKDHSGFDSFVMIVMSHGGDHDCIFGVDGRETSVKNLMIEFQEPKCPSLKEKPKVFIIQACRGLLNEVCKRSKSPAGNTILQAGPSTSVQADSELCFASLSHESTLPRSVFPREFDFLLAFATVPAYVCYRCEEHGTFFLQTLVEVIREHHNSHHFLEILTEVTKRVVERQSHHQFVVQVPAPTHTMTNLLYL